MTAMQVLKSLAVAAVVVVLAYSTYITLLVLAFGYVLGGD
jgi:hypothetical protein